MAKVLKLIAGSYDQPQEGDDPPDKRKLYTYRAGDVVKPRDDEERKRLLELGAVEEVDQESGSPDQAAEQVRARQEQADREAESQAKLDPAPKRRKS